MPYQEEIFAGILRNPYSLYFFGNWGSGFIRLPFSEIVMNKNWSYLNGLV